MKKYKLLKDLPFAKAGEIFKEMLDDDEKVLAPEKWVNFRHEIFVEELDNLNYWFEEIEQFEDKDFFAAGANVVYKLSFDTFSFDESTKAEFRKRAEQHKLIGNYFETKKEAEKHLEWLKARAVLLEDAKPKADPEEGIYGVRYLPTVGIIQPYNVRGSYSSEIRFSSEADAHASIKNHAKEWKIYLGVE